MNQPYLIPFASGTKNGGGSGFKKLVEMQRAGLIAAHIPAVVSNIKGGGVEEKARELGISFEHFPKDIRTPETHVALVHGFGGDNAFVALSGCLWLVPMKESPDDPSPGLDPRFVFNIHPGPLSIKDENGHPRFGGTGMHGDHVHEAVLDAKVPYTAVTIHFVTKEYDKGPIVFEYPIPILPGDTLETLRARVNWNEHQYQWWVTNLIVTRQIRWDGKDPASLKVPDWYTWHLPLAA